METPGPVELIVAVLLAAAYWLGPLLMNEYTRESKILVLKRMFNHYLTEGTKSKRALRCLMMLINNYDSVKNKEILFGGDESAWEEAEKTLCIEHRDRWYRWTIHFHTAVIGPIMIPILVYCLKKTIGKRRS